MIIFLSILAIFMVILEILAVSLVILIALDLLISYYKDVRSRSSKASKVKDSVTAMMQKEQLRREKEASAYEGFFEESYVLGFDSVGALRYRGQGVLTEEALAYYREMDELIDAPIFENTEEL